MAIYPHVLQLDYHLQVLPQFLWLASLRDKYGEQKFPIIAHRFLDLVEQLWTGGPEPVSGLVESFSFVPESKRERFVDQHREAVRLAVIEPFSAALRLYPDCPMRWVWDYYPTAEDEPGLGTGLASLKRWTQSLLDREAEPSNEARAIVFARYMKTGRVSISDASLIEELKAYPQCKNRRLTESRVRADSNAVFGHVLQGFSWGTAFWIANGRISMCNTDATPVQEDGKPAQELPLAGLGDRLRQAHDEFLAAIRTDYMKCVPDPATFEKSTALSGLLARSCALALDVFTERSLWIAEIGGIILRCQCETLIILAWLLYKDDASIYKQFFQYSMGQQDLYGLKLADYDGYRKAFKALYIGGDELANAMSKDSWAAQSRTIDLGNWAGIDARKMAEEGGTKAFYDLVFSLYSADVHSQFVSVAKWNMMPCTNPLHNYHLLPAFGRRVVNLALPLTACILLKETCQRFFQYYKVTPTCIGVLARLLADPAVAVLDDVSTRGAPSRG